MEGLLTVRFVLNRRVELLHSVQVEGGRVLHRRMINRSLDQLRNLLLDEDKVPELSGVEMFM